MILLTSFKIKQFFSFEEFSNLRLYYSSREERILKELKSKIFGFFFPIALEFSEEKSFQY